MIPAQPFPASFLSALDGVPELKSLFQFPGTEAYLLNNTCWNFDCMQVRPNGARKEGESNQTARGQRSVQLQRGAR